MWQPAENILYSLTGKSSFNDVTKEELQSIGGKFPYFSAAQFLLAKKLSLSEDENAGVAAQKAVIHFSDALWFHYSVSQEYSDFNETGDDNYSNEILDVEELIFADKENEPILQKPVEKIFTTRDAEPEDAYEETSGESTESNEKISNLLKEQAAAFGKPIEEEEIITVENVPYHRVDYFDSQGIKLEEDETTDKLGTQLKRFTDWLKDMKRINVNPSDLGTDEASETQVQHLAEHSNESEAVITEAMAQVLLKQGKRDEAIDIYKKLSFKNPSESAYFAAKIKEVKG